MEKEPDYDELTAFIERSAQAFLIGVERLGLSDPANRINAIEHFEALALAAARKEYVFASEAAERLEVEPPKNVKVAEVTQVPNGYEVVWRPRHSEVEKEDTRGYQRWAFDVPATVTMECDVMANETDVAKIIIDGLMRSATGSNPTAWARTHAHTFPSVLGYKMGSGVSNIRRTGKGIADDVFKAEQLARQKGLPNAQ